MREALPLLYSLAIDNLDAMELGALTAACQTEDEFLGLAAPHIKWLSQVTEFLAGSGQFSITLAPHHSGQNHSQPSAPRALRLIDPNNLNAYAVAFAKSLKAGLAASMPGDADAEQRLAWLARWIAVAALNAQLALVPDQGNWSVALDAPTGETDALDASVRALMMVMPAPIVEAMPIYKAADRDAYLDYVATIRQEFTALSILEPTSRAHYAKAGRLASLIAYAAATLSTSERDSSAPSRKLSTLAREFLLQEGLADCHEAADQMLLKIDIGDAYEVRQTGRDKKLRLPTKNAQHQAAFRGKTEFLKHWGRRCARVGVLTPATIGRKTKSREQIEMLARLIFPHDTAYPWTQSESTSLQPKMTPLSAGANSITVELPKLP